MTTGGTGSVDPFFDELRRRQPDIDIVVLPPDVTPADAPVPEQGAETAYAEEVEAALDDLALRSGLRGGDRLGRWRRTRGGAHRFRARLAYDDLTPQESIALLRAVRDALVAAPGWDARPVPGGGARLVATGPGGRLTVSAHATPSTHLVEVTGPEVVLAQQEQHEEGHADG